MELTINIKCDALVEAINRVCDVTGSQATASEVKPAEKKNKPVGLKAVKEEPKKAEPVEEPKAEPKAEPVEEKTEGNQEEISLETVRAALAKLSKANGKEAAKEILEMFDASKLTEIPKEKYGELMKAIEEV